LIRFPYNEIFFFILHHEKKENNYFLKSLNTDCGNLFSFGEEGLLWGVSVICYG